MDRIRILVVDDHRLFAEALAVRLSREPDFRLLPLAHDEAQAKNILARFSPDVLVLDLSLGRGSGIGVLDHVRRHHPPVRTLMLTAVNSIDWLLEVVRHGATGWLPKTVDGDQLVRVVRGIARGEGWIPPELLSELLSRLVAGPPSDGPGVLARLTPREREVFEFMLAGSSRADIARRLYVSAETVRTHIQNLMAKLEVHSVLEAVSLGMRSGMRPPGDQGSWDHGAMGMSGSRSART